MKSNLYKFTIEHLEDKNGNSIKTDPLSFETRNHDDLFTIVEIMKKKATFDEADAAAFAIGLKLSGEVILKNKDSKLFKDFTPHFRNFMKELKK